MGKTNNSGLGVGVGSSPQMNLSQTEFDTKVNELVKKDEMIRPLIEAGVKFTKDDVIFVTKDKSNQLIWLEKGNDNAGLNHILKKHGDEFTSKYNISKENITEHINEIITNGNIEYSRLTKKGNRDGIEKMYSYNENYYMLSGIGTNGFIVSAYPINEKEAIRLKKRYKK